MITPWVFASFMAALKKHGAKTCLDRDQKWYFANSGFVVEKDCQDRHCKIRVFVGITGVLLLLHILRSNEGLS
jgi:hypothetical protein